LNKWESRFKENLIEYENLNTMEISFYGKEGKNILKLYQEISPNLDAFFYGKALKFFSVNKLTYN